MVSLYFLVTFWFDFPSQANMTRVSTSVMAVMGHSHCVVIMFNLSRLLTEKSPSMCLSACDIVAYIWQGYGRRMEFLVSSKFCVLVMFSKRLRHIFERESEWLGFFMLSWYCLSVEKHEATRWNPNHRSSSLHSQTCSFCNHNANPRRLNITILQHISHA